ASAACGSGDRVGSVGAAAREGRSGEPSGGRGRPPRRLSLRAPGGASLNGKLNRDLSRQCQRTEVGQLPVWERTRRSAEAPRRLAPARLQFVLEPDAVALFARFLLTGQLAVAARAGQPPRRRVDKEFAALATGKIATLVFTRHEQLSLPGLDCGA